MKERRIGIGIFQRSLWEEREGIRRAHHFSKKKDNKLLTIEIADIKEVNNSGHR